MRFVRRGNEGRWLARGYVVVEEYEAPTPALRRAIAAGDIIPMALVEQRKRVIKNQQAKKENAKRMAARKKAAKKEQ